LNEVRHKLIIGVYDSATGAREELADGNDALEIKTISIQFPGGSGLP